METDKWPNPISVLLVDDSSQFRHILRQFLSRIPWVSIAHEVESGEDAITCLQQNHYDLILMDISMKGMNGLTATHKIKKQKKAPIVVILSQHENNEYVTQANAVGADGFVVKSDLFSSLKPVLHNALTKAQTAKNKNNM